MGRTINRLKYAGRDIAAAVVKEHFEAFLFCLYFCYRPMRVALMSTDLLDEIYERGSLRRRLDRLNKRGYIHKIKGRHDVTFLFSKDRRFDFLGDKLALKNKLFKKGWDGRWRLVIYDVPSKLDSERNALRNYLAELGFGKVQLSSWVSCYDCASQIDAFCRERDTLKYVCIYEGKFFSGKDEVTLVEKAWGLNALKEKYLSLIAQAESLTRDIETQDVDKKKYYQEYLGLFGFYKEVLLADPFLPKGFSDIWKIREKAESGLLRLFSLLTGLSCLNQK